MHSMLGYTFLGDTFIDNLKKVVDIYSEANIIRTIDNVDCTL